MQPSDYDFHGQIPRAVLERYLSRSLTMNNLLRGVGCIEDHLRMIGALGAKFLGRTLVDWDSALALPSLLATARPLVERVHAVDPQIVLQVGVFEAVPEELSQIAVPAAVAAAFDQEPEPRCYRYADMLFRDGSYVDLWRKGVSVPDITRVETQMWFYHRVCAYIDIGVEAIHFGQVQLMGRDDPGLRSWFSLLERVRRYAAVHARRGMVLCDAHVSSGVDCYGLTPIAPNQPLGYALDGRLLFDFHALPLRIAEIPGRPHEAELRVGHLDAIYGRSMGGIAPSGWACEHLPYLVDVDYWGKTGRGGESVAGKIEALQGIDSRFWVWGWDEMSWLGHQTPAYRDAWLRYAWRWVRETDPNGFMELPGQQPMTDPGGYYRANTPSPACPDGGGQEETIAAIWRADGG